MPGVVSERKTARRKVATRGRDRPGRGSGRSAVPAAAPLFATGANAPARRRTGPVRRVGPRLVLPGSVRAGRTLVYAVVFANPGKLAVPLPPCPADTEHTVIPTKEIYGLDCRGVPPSPPTPRCATR